MHLTPTTLTYRKPAGIFFSILTCLLLFAARTQAQTFTVNAGATPACYSGTTSCVATATVLPPNAVTYTWASSTISGICNPVIAASPGGTTATISFYCCGVFSFTCTALDINGNSIQSASFTKTIGCPPNVTISGTSTLCAGNTATLVAANAQSYTWTTGQINSQLTATPLSTTSYTVHGSSASGCSSSASHTITVINLPSPNFTYSQSNGQVFFTNLTTNTAVATGFVWLFHNGQIDFQANTTFTYTSNGVYSVTLTANSNCGNVVHVGTVTVTSVPIPTCAASFNYSVSPSGAATFTSTSTGTVSNTSYFWTFGNGNTYNATGNPGIYASTTYTPGTYTSTLQIVNPQPGCSHSTNVVITVLPPPCLLVPSFSIGMVSNNSYSFTSTSVGTVSNSVYSWSFGDGATASGSLVLHTYTTSGTHTVILTVDNGWSCVLNTQSVVTPSVCNFVANFTHTVQTNGQVQFGNTSLNTQQSTNYYWDFGDGTFSMQQNPVHVYQSGGTYYVSLKLTDGPNYCKDTLTQAINVTSAPCTANSGFTVYPSNTPQYWYATPQYPWNIVSATWDWGDGTRSYSLYTTHQYAAAGSYSICLSVTVSCGNSSSYCYSKYISKGTESASDILYVNVVPFAISTGLAENEAEALSYHIYPNPNAGEFMIHLNREAAGLSVQVFDLLGKEVYSDTIPKDHSGNARNIHLGDVNNGIYFVRIVSGNKSTTGKIVVNR